MAYDKIEVPAPGEKITMGEDGHLLVPDHPIILFMEGDGIGVDIIPPMMQVVDAAVEKAYGSEKKIEWMEIYASEKASETRLPNETLDAATEYIVSIKGPLAAPTGGESRNLDVALRQMLDLYVCQRPVRWFEGVPSPVKRPELIDMVVFRENSEDLYAGIEWQEGTSEAREVIEFLQDRMGVTQIRFPQTSGIGVKPVSQEGTYRLVKAAIQYAIDNDRDSVTLVHKGDIMKFTEGAFRDWGYETAVNEFGAIPLDDRPEHVIKLGNREIVIKDVLADAMLQQILTRPAEYDVIAAPNLNGNYISDALAACVGGIGMAPGANLNYDTGVALFEATHGTAPEHAGQDTANPGSLILSAEMMLRYMGWTKAADLILNGVNGAISRRKVTRDLERQMEGATRLKCSEFGQAIVDSM